MGIRKKGYGRISKVTPEDAVVILQYYTYCVAAPELRETDIVDWCKAKYPAFYT